MPAYRTAGDGDYRRLNNRRQLCAARIPIILTRLTGAFRDAVRSSQKTEEIEKNNREHKCE